MTDGEIQDRAQVQALCVVKAGFQKSYKILRTLDDGGEWNLLILREYANLAAFEANEEKADAAVAADRRH